MLTRDELNRIDDDIWSIDPEQAWVNNLAISLAETTPETRCWTPEDYIGQTRTVTIPNGVIGAERRERHVDVLVTAAMVAAAIKLAADLAPLQ